MGGWVSQVDMSKVNLEVLRGWVAKKTVELLGTEDEVLTNFVADMLEKDRVCVCP
jgi:serine/arginine repetitive matrix protein 1